jgi:hypothetical protein
MFILLIATALTYTGALLALIALLYKICAPSPEALAQPRPAVKKGPLSREWLRELRAAHAAVVREVRNIIANAPIDRFDLAKQLFRCQLQFSASTIYARWMLALHRS